ncbi:MULTISPECIES: carbohydrate ABC transporter permease [Paenibacillus]|jgi:multiple sugar transport system permease protein|uniref:Multiple sugar transport system permease n=2 Tax=Paenibacillus barengoltzii TaxID=343517 RepID=R9LJQ4_9BACL|nr:MULTISPECIES: carbohydrate ABC transporter permease [Paenibacillus]EOS58955.1 multiple sugar transport system permease [Paenibacillus barengoltzii G22]MDU0330917.1 carbohydrate ABC transporter permease [Paenibacillus sp. 3LSP]SMF41403.1 carbohydrate ABC transporter membrane protein 2, CUT1 family (TC 3.A.1.1.-) [Paenibacillus barengoltzii J12]
MENTSTARTQAVSGRTWKWVNKTIIYVIVTFLAAVILVPFFWMVSTALQADGDIFAWPPQWIPDPPQWHNFVEAWTAMPFNRYLFNTIFIVVLGIIAELISATIVAYGFARFRFPGSGLIFLVLLATMMLPFHVTLIPTFLIWQKFGLVGQFDPLVLRAWTAWGPFYIFLLRQFFMTLPRELDDAAEMDGSNFFQTFVYIMLPQVKPALLAVAIFAFRGYWNDFLGPLIYLSDMKMYTLNVGMYFFMGGVNEAPQWNYLMAMSTLVALPVILLFFMAQRYFIEGITFTGMKD